MEVASLYPPHRGGVQLDGSAQSRTADARGRRPAVGDASWLGQFVRARLTEVGLGLALLVGIAVPLERLTSSLLLSNLDRTGLVMLEVRDLAPGTYRSFDGRNSRLYVLRTRDDRVQAFTLPLHQGKVAMPASQWGRSAYDCADFGPDAAGQNLLADGVFRCRDRGVPDWGAARWRWQYDGSPAPQIDDSYISALPRVTSVRTGALIRIYRWDILW